MSTSVGIFCSCLPFANQVFAALTNDFSLDIFEPEVDEAGLVPTPGFERFPTTIFSLFTASLVGLSAARVCVTALLDDQFHKLLKRKYNLKETKRYPAHSLPS